MLAGDVVVLHLLGQPGGFFQHAHQLARGFGRFPGATHLGQAAQVRLHHLQDAVRLGAHLVQQRANDAVLFGQLGFQQVERFHLRVAFLIGGFLGPGHGVLGLQGQAIHAKSHDGSLS